MEKVIIKLSRNDIGQLLDGLEVLAEQWEATAVYLESGEIREDVCIRESHHAHEADSIAGTYRSLIGTISEQLPVRQ